MGLLDNLEKSCKNCYIAGDFNIDLFRMDSNNETSSFFNNLLTYSFFPSIVKPTRITDVSATLIDVYRNAFDVIDDIQPGILYTDICDHLPVFIVKYGHKVKKYYKKVSKRIYSKSGEENFIQDVSSLDWSTIYNNLAMFPAIYRKASIQMFL